MKRITGKGKLKEALTHTAEAFGTEPTIELQKNRQATVQGARGIIEYTEELIRISLADMEVRFYGEGLCIGCLNQDSLEIQGKILRLEYV